MKIPVLVDDQMLVCKWKFQAYIINQTFMLSKLCVTTFCMFCEFIYFLYDVSVV